MTIKKKFTNFLSKNKKKLSVIGSSSFITVVSAISSYAAEADSSPVSAVQSFQITDNMLLPIQNTINSAVEKCVPYGIGIMCTFIGVSIIKRMVFSFI